MADDVLLNKVAIVERCLGHIREEYHGREDELDTNPTRQDSIVLNLQRACEASIDLAMHLVRRRRLGLPQESRLAFLMLKEAGLLDAMLSARMQAMVGFRNVAVHNYQKLSLDVARAILSYRLNDFVRFTDAAMKMNLDENKDIE